MPLDGWSLQQSEFGVVSRTQNWYSMLSTAFSAHIIAQTAVNQIHQTQ